MGLRRAAEPLSEVRGDDADATFCVEPSLVLGLEQVVERVHVFGVDGGEPPADVGSAWVPVRHRGIDAQQVDLEGEDRERGLLPPLVFDRRGI